MNVFAHHDFDHHEQIVFCNDAATGLKAIIAIHSTALGPALGGSRMFAYPDEQAALTDVLRLSRGMSYKAAMAGLPLGGGKSVIIGDPRKDKTPALMRAFGDAVERLGGRYITAEDSGTSVPDMQAVAERTRHVSGVAEKPDGRGGLRSGDPSPQTARGCFVGLKAAVGHRLGRNGGADLAGLSVAVQGVGNVGFDLARRLTEAGATVYACDVYTPNLERAVAELGVFALAPEALMDQPVDVFAPCALGGALNRDTLPRLQAAIVAGAANNQLSGPEIDLALQERGVLYAPDYVLNAGGLIDVADERDGFDPARVEARINGIGATLREIFQRADAEGRPTQQVADRIARERIAQGAVTAQAA